MKIAASCTYYAGTVGYVDLPEVESWDDVEDWYVKWDTFHYKLKGDEEWKEYEMNSNTMDIIDWKRPTTTEIYPCDDDFDINWDEEHDSCGG